MEINEIKYGFKLISVDDIEDIHVVLYQYEHIKSGGKVVYLKADDDNCCFAIGFRTLPTDSTGVCHIIEHSTLCGSKKYPLKEPFVNLLKGSLSTFLNAFTAYDWTMYPFASQTPKDFDNILSIYLDAVFNPLSVIDNKPFLQEGWHYELNNKDDDIVIKGVVYNEMKGAMSSVEDILTQATLESMYRDTPYRFNSGGDPDVIPTLTYDAYKQFYKKHYTPSNAMTYFYGNMDIEEKLKFIDENYFSKFEKTDQEIVINPQKPFVDLDMVKSYDVGDEDIKDNTYMSLCYGLDHYSNIETLLAIRILCDALLSKNSSPVKKALLDANLGQDVVCQIDDDNIIPALHVYLYKTNPNKKEEFKRLFEQQIANLVKNGIDKKLLLATINRSEFKAKECDMGTMPKGLVYAMSMIGSFNYNCNYLDSLEFSKYYKKFKEKLYDNYFEDLLDRLILHSNHNVLVMVVPSKTLNKEKEAKMAQDMKDLKASLSSKQINDLVKQTKDLLAYQNREDSKKELASLPKLKLKDIPSKINYLATKKDRVNGMKAITHTLNTNGIAYLRMYFDLDRISYEDSPYVSLLVSLLLNVRTSKYDLDTLTNLKNTYLGDLFVRSKVSSTKDLQTKFSLNVFASALKENVQYIPELINEILLHSKFTKKEVLTIVKQQATAIKQGLIQNGMWLAIQESAKHYKKGSALSAKTYSGYEAYQFFNDLANNYDHKKVVAKLKEIRDVIFTKDNVLISLSGEKDTIDVLKEAVRNIKLSRKHYENKLNIKLTPPTKEAIIIPSGVSYNAISSDLALLGESYSGKMDVLAHIINYDFLWPEIRVKGGAYGCTIDPCYNNLISFGTYRDPNVAASYFTIKSVVDYLTNFKVSKNEFNTYIIGTCGEIGGSISNPALVNSWDSNYILGFTKKDILDRKKQILHTKQEDIVNFAKMFTKMFENCSECSIGNEAKIKEYQFDNIKSI